MNTQIKTNTRFRLFVGDTGALPTNRNYVVFKWAEPDTHVLFSVSQQGKGLRVHFTADKKSLRKLKQAVYEFCDFCFKFFWYSEMIFAIIPKEKLGIIRFTKRCGFKRLFSYKNLITLVKEKPCRL
jgi:hypothetical protein